MPPHHDQAHLATTKMPAVLRQKKILILMLLAKGLEQPIVHSKRQATSLVCMQACTP